MENESDVEVIDVENYHDSNDKVFSHPSLVMSAIRRCLELGSKEMRSGWFNEKVDKSGFVIKTYIEDTRSAFISAVKMTMALMQPDLDTEAIEKINKLLVDLKNEFNRLDEEENEEFYRLPPVIQHQRLVSGIIPLKGMLSKELPYYNSFIDIQVDTYRNIFGELNKLTERRDYFKGEDLEN